MTVDFSHLPLGKQTTYSNRYDASLLVAVPRALTRDFWQPEIPLPFVGCDDWTGYEVSWLDPKGKPQVGCLTVSYSALTENIVESKSLKLYLNGFNQTCVGSMDQLVKTITADIGKIVGKEVSVELHRNSQEFALALDPWSDHCIDDLEITIDQYQTDATLLECNPALKVEQTLVSHLFRSNCPVTGQPDWASIRFCYKGPEISGKSLLRYICSYRLHQGFHEQCIERIFCDLWTQCKPEKLSVEGRFTRRGGLDINPFRASHGDMQPLKKRQLRQ